MAWTDALADAASAFINRLTEEDVGRGFIGQEDFARSLQLDPYSCGARATYAVLQHYGCAVEYPALKRELGTNLWYGTDERQIVLALRRRGIRAKPYPRMGMRDLERTLRAGGVIIVEVDGNHYATVYGMDSKAVYVADPSIARGASARHTRRSFRERWDRAGITAIP